MTYLVLARKWRPSQFSQIVGQEAIAKTLQNAIALNRVAHAILFSGSRGIGKTTVARILAKALNCEKGPTTSPCDECSNCREIAAGHSMDVREIDGASATSVDDVRELRDNVRYSPSKSKHKIFIIDEVHMLSTSAFNALLKTIEEPPPGVFFVFATTEPQKIPDTILSRCQRYDFRQISQDQIAQHLSTIAKQEKIQISAMGLHRIARQAQGSLRDALSLLDQVVSFSAKGCSLEISEDEVALVLGLTDRSMIDQTVDALLAYESKTVLEVFSQVWGRGLDAKSFLTEVCEEIRNLLLCKADTDGSVMVASDDQRKFLRERASKTTEEELERWFDLFRQAISDMARSEFPRYVVEVAFLKATRRPARIPLAQWVERLEKLEIRLGGKNLPPGPVASTPQGPIRSDSSQGNPEKDSLPGQVLASGAGMGWEEFVEVVKRQKPAFAAILLQAVEGRIEDGRIKLVFDEGSFCVARAKDSDFGSFLGKLALEKFGQKTSVQIETRAKPLSSSPTGSRLDRAREKEALENPMVQRAVSLFQARIEQIKPLES